MMDSPLFAQMLNQWWRLPSRKNDSGIPVTPDPELLRAQAQVVTVRQDKGLATLDGQEVYDEEVSVDESKLLAYLAQVSEQRHESFDPQQWQKTLKSTDMRGELWIDAQTFFLRRIQWHISSNDSRKPMDLTFQIDLQSHNAADPITPPADAKLLPVNPFESLRGDMMPPPVGGSGLPPELQKQLMDKLSNFKH